MAATVQFPTNIRPFHVDIPDEKLADLRRRIAATRWPSTELVNDSSQGVQSKMLQKLARYWEKEHDWRKVEKSSTPCLSSPRRSTGSRFTSFTSSRVTRTRCRSSSRTAGLGRSSRCST